MASINLQGDTSGSISISAPSVAGSNTLTLPATTQTLATQNALGVRNLIINGDMRIDQRGGTVTVNNASDNYGIDRWQGRGTASDGVFTTVQDTESPTGFTNSAKISVTTADSSIGTSERYEYRHRIEGNNIAHLDWGSSDAKKVTLSFYVRSSVTGTFGGSLTNSAGNRSYVFSYTINTANTWERKTITIDGDTSGTWLTTNGIGIGVTFSLGHGSDYVEDAGSWYASYEAAVTSQTNLIATLGATWYLTGVQLEVGDTATPFEHRPYDMELQRCQRYYQLHDGMVAANGNESTSVYPAISFKTEMRATPSLSQSGVINFVRPSVAVYNQSSISVNLSSGSSTGARLRLLNFSGLTTNQIYIQHNSGAYVTLDAEL